MKEGKSNTVMLTIIGIATLLIAVVGATFAYFSAVLTGNETSKSVSIKSATIGTVYDGGNVITAANIYPKNSYVWGEKDFTIKTTASVGSSVNYTVNLIVTESGTCSNAAYDDSASCTAASAVWTAGSSFTAGSLKYTVEVDTANTTSGNGTTMTAITTTDLPVALGTHALGTGTLAGAGASEVKHAYKLKIYFPETGTDQNSEQGKLFKAHLEVIGANL